MEEIGENQTIGYTIRRVENSVRIVNLNVVMRFTYFTHYNILKVRNIN